MKTFFVFLSAIVLFSCSQLSATVIESGSIASMCITGKGPGQDAAINPHAGEASMAIVKNLGSTNFEIRHTDSNQNIIEIIPIDANQTKKIALGATDHIYFDAYEPYKTRVAFRKR